VLAVVLVVAPLVVPAGCGGGRPPVVNGGSTTVPATQPLDARTQFAGRAAAAKDRRFTAGYALTQPGRPVRTVTVTLAADGTWRMDLPGGALGGTLDVAVIGLRDALYECVPGPAVSCVKVAAPDGTLPVAADPRVEHVFTDWLDVFIDRRAALSVAPAPALHGAPGDCFSVEPTTVSLASPVDAGVYCYAADGTLTAARAGFGALVLATAVGPPPSTVTLPGPVVPGPPPNTSPPPPAPSTPPATATPTHR
jgi:hypothetical protein